MTDTTGGSELRARVVRGLRAFGNELELYVGASGRELDMHRTDLTGLALVMDATRQGEAVTPGRLSARMQLSAPATSAMLDRLERLGHVRRSRHATDRRSVVVEMTEHAQQVGRGMFTTLGAHVEAVMDEYDDEQLALVAQFLERVAEATSAARQDVRGPRRPGG